MISGGVAGVAGGSGGSPDPTSSAPTTGARVTGAPMAATSAAAGAPARGVAAAAAAVPPLAGAGDAVVEGGEGTLLCPVNACGVVHVGATVEEHLRRVHSGTDVPAVVLTAHRLGTCPNCSGPYTLVKTAAGRHPFSAYVARCAAPPVLAAEYAAGNAPTACPVAECARRVKAAPDKAPVALHLAWCHLFFEVPAATVREMKLAPCPRCRQPYRAQKPRSDSSPLAVHVFKGNADDAVPVAAAAPPLPPAPPPSASGAPADLTTAPAAGNAPAGGTSSTPPSSMLRTPTPLSTPLPSSTPPRPPTPPSPASSPPVDPDAPPPPLFTADYGEWFRLRGEFLQAAAPTVADWAPLVASCAWTQGTVPLVFAEGRDALGANMFR